MRSIKALFFIAAATLVHATAADIVWIASTENGDKPGIGLRLVQSQRGISGSAYVLHPDHAHDFSHGAKRKMEVTNSTTREVRFRVDWGDAKERSYILQFDEPLASKPVKGTLREVGETGQPTELTFTRAKSK
jgi:hypothetical protein